DALYRMDYRPMIARHLESAADISIAVIPVDEARAPGFGLLKIDDNRRIVEFSEKPQTPEAIHPMASPESVIRRCGVEDSSRLYLASMGIYLFNIDALDRALATLGQTDFGREVIPTAISQQRVFAELFDGFWEDIGTIRAFYETNLLLTEKEPPFDFFDTDWPIFTHARFLPPAKLRLCEIDHAIISEGCVISNATVRRSVVGLRSVIGHGAVIEESVLMGCDFYRYHKDEVVTRVHHLLPSIDREATVKRAIVDKGAVIGEGAVIDPPDGVPDTDGECFHIRDGIAVIPRGAHVPAGFNLSEALK
ncbi:glucose-1-phosphate adenylyltransferase, partial [Candidatus Sumerlaeota bacterium]|nr:glucose-1-phosphate adenylyltransferase [Candidatus Sumerlaeota bacterium]